MSGDGKGAKKGEGSVQRVIREVHGGTSYPTLTKTNYSDWALLMKVKLKARALWDVIEYGGADSQEEMMALDALCGAVPPEMVPSIAKKETAKEAWDAIATMRVGDDRVKKSAAEQLHRKFDLATFNDGESVEDFALRLEGMAAHLGTLDEEIEEKVIVAKILRSLPPRFKQIVIAIRTMLDISTMTVADLTGRLKEVEESYEEAPPSLQHEGKLYLTEEEWDARRKKREAENNTGGGSSKNGGGNRGGGGTSRGGGRRGRGRGRAGGQTNGPPNPSKPTGNECHRCGKLGHWARECRSRPRQEQAHATAEEEEASLWVARCSTNHSPPLPQPTPPAAPAAQIEIREEKVFAQLRDEGEREAATWVLDSGATNHMSGARAAFSEIDAAVRGTVRFGDDSVAQIEGRGTVVFVCKNGELRSFAGVYFIPRLTTNIVSLGQLDEIHYKIDIDDGVMRIREPDGRLMAKVAREANRLYLLRIKMAQPTCLTAKVRGHVDEETWRWHERFGHVNMAALRKLAREELVRGLPEIKSVDKLCEACQAGKQRRTSFPVKAEYRAQRHLELVHGDLCGPISPATP